MMIANRLSPKLRSALQQSIQRHGCRPMTIISKESAEQHKNMDYTARMKKTGRPTSPHVTIYAFPVGAVTSITNRVTGCALSVGCAGLGFAELVGGNGTALWLMQWAGSQGMLITAGAKFTVAFPIVYHYFGAIRHFRWDYLPDTLDTKDVEKSSIALLAASLVVSGGLMFV